MQYSSQWPNQFYGQGTNQNIGTTPTEQMMQSGMGGLSQVMQADRNTGYYGPSQPQYQGGMVGGQQQYGGSYTTPQYGQTTAQYGYQQSNQFRGYGQGTNQNFGTTPTEQMMRRGMGGLSQVMQADRNTGYYGPSQPQYQGGMVGGQQQYGGSYTTPQYGQTTAQYGYQQFNQFGGYGQGTNQNFGTTPTEQMMRGGMGGLSQVMQADRNTGYYGPSQPQYQSGMGGGQQQYGGSYTTPQYGQTTAQYGYQQSNQFGGYDQGTNQNIGTTPSEQMMQGSMGGLSQMMRADRNTGYYGPSQPQQMVTGTGQQGGDC